MDIHFIRGITTALLLIIFIGIVVWAYSSKRKASFSEAEMLPFDEDEVKSIKKHEGFKP